GRLWARTRAAARAAGTPPAEGPPIVHLAHEQGEEQGREGGVQPEVLGLAQEAAAGHADRRADEPGRVEQEPGPDQLARVEAASALVRDHPRLVDRDLADQQPPPPRP